MPDQPTDTSRSRNAIRLALGAALGSALGIITAKHAARSGQWAAEERNERQIDALQDTSDEVGAHSCAPSQLSALSSQSSVLSPDHPDWERLPPTHLPRPTYWPVVLALGIMFLMWGVVTTVAISVVGLLLLAIALGGWIGELRHGD